MHFTTLRLALVALSLVLGAQAIQLPIIDAGPRPLNKRGSGGLEAEPNGTEFLWVIEDTYEGQNFFE